MSSTNKTQQYKEMLDLIRDLTEISKVFVNDPAISPAKRVGFASYTIEKAENFLETENNGLKMCEICQAFNKVNHATGPVFNPCFENCLSRKYRYQKGKTVELTCKNFSHISSMKIK